MALVSVQGDASVEIYEGLLMLQHRGQDSAGMVTTDGHRFREHKGNGLVREVFGQQRTLDSLAGRPPARQALPVSPKAVAVPMCFEITMPSCSADLPRHSQKSAAPIPRM